MIIAVPEDHLFTGQPVLFGNPPRIRVLRPDHGDQSWRPESVECIFHARTRRLRCITFAPQIATDMIGNFHFLFAFYFLHATATVTYQFAGGPQYHGPEPMSITLIAIHVPLDPNLDAFTVERGRIPLHRNRVAKDSFQRGDIIGSKLAQQQARGFQDHTLVHNSALGSSVFSPCSSCHSSRTLRSRASGTTILISTISSPRSPSRVAEGTPFSRRRSF